MTAQGTKRAMWTSSVLAVLFLAVAAYLFISHGVLRLRAMLADEQTQIFVEMRDRSLDSTNPGEIVGLLGYAVWYYPSGTHIRRT